MQIRISVLASGEFLLDGNPAELPALSEALEKADPKTDVVLYYREQPQAEPPAKALEIMSLIAARRLPVSMSGKPDFSDYVDRFGQSHPRQPGPSDPFQPAMPDVDLRRNPDEIFAQARKSAAGGIAIVRPDRGLLVLPPPPVSANTAELAKKLPKVIPADRHCHIAAICDTQFTMKQAANPLKAEDAGRAIPFLGFLIGWSQAGHKVWVFEGHPSALAAGLAGSEFLLLDSAMLPLLQPDWMAVAQRAMLPGGKVFLHHREKYQLLPLAPSPRPPGWRIAEPDGEASYANCLLTTLAKGTAQSVSIESGKPVPHPATLTTNPEQLEWIAGLPFRYNSLDTSKVIEILLNAAAKGKATSSPDEWVLTTKVVTQNQEPSVQKFVFRRERHLLRTTLHVSKL